MWRLGGAIAAVALGLMGSVAGASASVMIGQSVNSGVACGGSGYTDLQAGLAAPPAYIVPSPGGVITSWSHAGGGDPTVTLRLKLMRPTLTPNQFSVVGESATTPVIPNNLNSFATSIHAQPGDQIALSVLAGTSPACVFATGNPIDTVRQGPVDPAPGADVPMPVAAPQARVNLSAVLETQLVSLTGHPNAKVKLKRRKKSKAVTFAFTTGFSGLTFTCTLDAGPAAPCASPAQFRVRKGTHTFNVQAADARGALGDPVSFSFRVKKTK